MRTYFLLRKRSDETLGNQNHLDKQTETSHHLSNPALLIPPPRPRTLAPLHHKPAEGQIFKLPQPPEMNSSNPSFVVTFANGSKAINCVGMQNNASNQPTPIST